MYRKYINLSEKDRKFLTQLTEERPDMTDYYAKTIIVARRLEVMEGTEGWPRVFSREKDIGPDLLEILVKQYNFEFSRKSDLEAFILAQDNKRKN